MKMRTRSFRETLAQLPKFQYTNLPQLNPGQFWWNGYGVKPLETSKQMILLKKAPRRGDTQCLTNECANQHEYCDLNAETVFPKGIRLCWIRHQKKKTKTKTQPFKLKAATNSSCRGQLEACFWKSYKNSGTFSGDFTSSLNKGIHAVSCHLWQYFL